MPGQIFASIIFRGLGFIREYSEKLDTAKISTCTYTVYVRLYNVHVLCMSPILAYSRASYKYCELNVLADCYPSDRQTDTYTINTFDVSSISHNGGVLLQLLQGAGHCQLPTGGGEKELIRSWITPSPPSSDHGSPHHHQAQIMDPPIATKLRSWILHHHQAQIMDPPIATKLRSWIPITTKLRSWILHYHQAQIMDPPSPPSSDHGSSITTKLRSWILPPSSLGHIIPEL